MFAANSHGAGYMVARDGKVLISKGYMTWSEYWKAVKAEHFTADDSVVYHCRISTQAGVNPEMTHPFPLTRHVESCKLLDCSCSVGIAHNGVISLTTNPRDKEYSDTAHFVAEYLHYFIRTADDLRDPDCLDAIYHIARSKFAIMDGTGYVATIGDFIEEDNGILFSNTSYLPYVPHYRQFSFKNYTVERESFEDEMIDY